MLNIFKTLGCFFALCLLLQTGCVEKETLVLPTISDYDTYDENHNGRKHLIVGIVSGPYGDMFMDAVYPSLKELGYTVDLMQCDDYSIPNHCLARGDMDLNIFQHYSYLINSKFEFDLSLSAIAEIPTASMGIFSARYTSLNNIPNRGTVSLPNDVTNLARALSVLESAGIIRLSHTIDKTKARIDDIVSNPRNLRFFPKDANSLVQTLNQYDFSVINGNFALSGGLNLSRALFTERLSDYYYNIIAVRTDDLQEQFVIDIINILHSDAYREVIEDKTRVYSQFQRPKNFYEKLD